MVFTPRYGTHEALTGLSFPASTVNPPAGVGPSLDGMQRLAVSGLGRAIVVTEDYQAIALDPITEEGTMIGVTFAEQFADEDGQSCWGIAYCDGVWTALVATARHYSTGFSTVLADCVVCIQTSGAALPTLATDWTVGRTIIGHDTSIGVQFLTFSADWTSGGVLNGIRLGGGDCYFHFADGTIVPIASQVLTISSAGFYSVYASTDGSLSLSGGDALMGTFSIIGTTGTGWGPGIGGFWGHTNTTSGSPSTGYLPLLTDATAAPNVTQSEVGTDGHYGIDGGLFNTSTGHWDLRWCRTDDFTGIVAPAFGPLQSGIAILDADNIAGGHRHLRISHTTNSGFAYDYNQTVAGYFPTDMDFASFGIENRYHGPYLAGNTDPASSPSFPRWTPRSIPAVIGVGSGGVVFGNTGISSDAHPVGIGLGVGFSDGATCPDGGTWYFGATFGGGGGARLSPLHFSGPAPAVAWGPFGFTWYDGTTLSGYCAGTSFGDRRAALTIDAARVIGATTGRLGVTTAQVGLVAAEVTGASAGALTCPAPVAPSTAYAIKSSNGGLYAFASSSASPVLVLAGVMPVGDMVLDFKPSLQAPSERLVLVHGSSNLVTETVIDLTGPTKTDGTPFAWPTPALVTEAIVAAEWTGPTSFYTVFNVPWSLAASTA